MEGEKREYRERRGLGLEKEKKREWPVAAQSPEMPLLGLSEEDEEKKKEKKGTKRWSGREGKKKKRREGAYLATGCRQRRKWIQKPYLQFASQTMSENYRGYFSINHDFRLN